MNWPASFPGAAPKPAHVLPSEIPRCRGTTAGSFQKGRPATARRLQAGFSACQSIAAWGVSLFLAAGVILLTGCGAGPRADLIIINGPEPESLDPAIISAQADMRIASALFEGLTRYDPRTVEPIPGLAERWEISNEGRTYTFFLRPNLVWSTGEPLTADDVVYSWIRVLKPVTGSKYASQLYYVKNAAQFNGGEIDDHGLVGVRALDNGTVQVDLVDPTPFFLDLCAFSTLAVVPRQAIEKYGDRWLMARPLPASGAYELISWRLNDRVRLHRNPLYWDAENTRSEVVDLLPCTSASTALNLYESGAVDIVWDKELVPSPLMDVLRERPDFHTFSYLGVYFFRFNVTRAPFDDARVRQALALTVDKQRIVERITRAGELPIDHFVPPGIPGYEPAEGLPYNPEKARRLLAEAGYPGGQGFPRVAYLFNTQATHEKIAVEMQEMWRRELGIQIDLRSMEWRAFLPAQSSLNYDFSRSSWIGDYNDPNTFLDLFMSDNGNNRTGWKNEGYDTLLRRANAELDREKRAQLLREAEAMLVREEFPIVPLFVYVGMQYYNADRIQGIYPNVLNEHPIRAIYRGPRVRSPERPVSEIEL